MRLRKDIWVSSAGLSDMPCKITGSMCLSIGNCFSHGRCAECFPCSPPDQHTSAFALPQTSEGCLWPVSRLSRSLAYDCLSS